MLIKICGLCNMSATEAIADMRPDFCGFVFHASSPRYMEHSLSPVQLQHLRDRTKRVGVFVNSSLTDILSKIQTFHLDVIQLHGSETPGFASELRGRCPGIELWKAFGIEGRNSFSPVHEYVHSCSMVVFDVRDEQHGGTGRSFNWEYLEHYTGPIPFLLAGGITIENLSSALSAVARNPFGKGIDVSSGVETTPGVKSITRTKQFIDAVRSYASGG